MTPRSDVVSDLELLVRSRYGLLHIDTEEEERAVALLRHLSGRLALPLFTWTHARGLRRDGHDNAVYDTAQPATALSHVLSSRLTALYHFAGLGAQLQNEAIAAQVREVATELSNRSGALVLSGTGLDVPEALRPLLATVRLPVPNAADYRRLLQRIVRDVKQRGGSVRIELAPEEERRLFNHLRGLTLLESEKILTRAVVEDGRLTADDVRHVLQAKREVVEREGVLEYYPVEDNSTEVAGLDGLKEWLAKRRAIITSPDRAAAFGLSFPRGLLLIGVPGCGKSLCARAVAAEWGLPLLRLDTGALYNKYIGETEKNFRRAMQVAERVAPCVLFIDELEKAFAQGGEDGGVSQRVLGTFLTWLQDRQGDVFTVATANDVSRLPAEFLRKGRFDEIFFVDLPAAGARLEIARIHLRRRHQEPECLDLDALVQATEGFSGAELEQVVVSALYTAFAEGVALGTPHLLREAAATQPLSVVVKEKVDALREWARGRTVPAG